MAYTNEAARPVLRNLIEKAIEHGTPAAELSAEGTATDGAALPSEAQRAETTELTGDRYHQPSVFVAIRETDDDVETHVVDDGPGIPDDRRDSVFDPRAGDTHGGGSISSRHSLRASAAISPSPTPPAKPTRPSPTPP